MSSWSLPGRDLGVYRKGQADYCPQRGKGKENPREGERQGRGGGRLPIRAVFGGKGVFKLGVDAGSESNGDEGGTPAGGLGNGRDLIVKLEEGIIPS